MAERDRLARDYQNAIDSLEEKVLQISAERDAMAGMLDAALAERDALLASHSWRVTAVDFSAVAIGKGKELERRELGQPAIGWGVADATTFTSPGPVDLALLCYLQLPAGERRAAVRRAAQALVSGGILLVIAHDSRNLTDGTGGPQDPTVLYTAADVAGGPWIPCGPVPG